MASTAPATANQGTYTNHNGANYTGALTVLTSLFFMWGFITCLNDILIPHLKAVFDLNYTQAMMIQFTFFTAYFLVSLPSGFLVEKVGYKTGIIIGLSTAGVGCLLFYPAAGERSYPIFLFALFVLASGITLLQVAANPYVAILGKPETSSARLNLTQAFNSLGTTIAPYLGALFILSQAVKTTEEIALMDPAQKSVYQAAEAAAVQNPYLGLAAALFLIAVVIALFKLPKIEAADQQSSNGSGTLDHIHDSAWKYRHLVLGAVGIFVYVGAEVSIGSFLVNYISLPEIGNMVEAEAGKYVSFYWGGAMVGRFAGSYILTRINPGKVLAANAAVAGILVIVTMLTDGHFAMWSVLIIGLFNSIMFPTIFTLAVDGLGKHTGQGSGILCMAIVGGAIVPVLQGMLADQIGIHHAFILPVLCYGFIVYYGLKGYKADLAHA